jgi:hypothetical protein
VEPYTYNFLDAMVERFREQWETNPAYRARMSGVVGLAAIFGLCSCALIFSLVANSMFTSVGFGAGGSGGGPQQQGNGNYDNVIPTFPTNAVPSWTVDGSPAVQVVPTSGTPAPTATVPPTETAVATATQCFSNCGGGGGGGGGNVTYTTSWSPASWKSCANGGTCTFSVHTSKSGVGVYYQATFCNGATIISPQGQTDANGNWSYSFAGPPLGSNPSADVDVQVQGGARQHFYPPCT